MQVHFPGQGVSAFLGPGFFIVRILAACVGRLCEAGALLEPARAARVETFGEIPTCPGQARPPSEGESARAEPASSRILAPRGPGAHRRVACRPGDRRVAGPWAGTGSCFVQGMGRHGVRGSPQKLQTPRRSRWKLERSAARPAEDRGVAGPRALREQPAGDRRNPGHNPLPPLLSPLPEPIRAV